MHPNKCFGVISSKVSHPCKCFDVIPCKEMYPYKCFEKVPVNIISYLCTKTYLMLDFNLILKNENVVLRPMVEDDYHEYVKITNDKSLWKYFAQDLSDPDQLKTWVGKALKQLSEKLRLPFTIIDKGNGSIIGSTSFLNISMYDKRLEIGGTWIGKNYQGKGINDQIKYLMLEYCFETLKLERVELKTDVLNTFSRNAMKRIGFTEEGILRSHMLMTNNRRRDSIYYSMLRNEWEGLKK